MSKLTNREQEILNYLCHGYTKQEIMNKLNIAECTYSTHLTNICRKKTCNNIAELIAARIMDLEIELESKTNTIDKLSKEINYYRTKITELNKEYKTSLETRTETLCIQSLIIETIYSNLITKKFTTLKDVYRYIKDNMKHITILLNDNSKEYNKWN